MEEEVKTYECRDCILSTICNKTEDDKPCEFFVGAEKGNAYDRN